MFRKLLIIFSFIFLLQTHLKSEEHPNYYVNLGSFSGERSFQEFIGSQIETSVFAPMWHFNNLRIQTGLSFWSFKKELLSDDYLLNKLSIPIRFLYYMNVKQKINMYGGVAYTLDMLIENYEKTETYYSIGKQIIIGTEYQLLKDYVLTLEYIDLFSQFKNLDNLRTSGTILRFGFGGRF